MKGLYRAKIGFLILGDAAVFLVSLFLSLALRYQRDLSPYLVRLHVLPFAILFVLWVMVFYIAGLYTMRFLRNGFDFLKVLSISMAANAVLAVAFFYAFPSFGIAPKLNLFVFIVVFAAGELWWRRYFNRLIGNRQGAVNLLVFGNGPTAEKIVAAVRENPQMGYAVKLQLPDEPMTFETLKKLVDENDIRLVIIPHHLKKQAAAANAFFRLLLSGTSVRDIPYFYENVFRCIPIADLEESWFLENVIETHPFYDKAKRILEFAGALLLQIVLLPLEILIALGVKMSSAGPVIYSQVRTGKNNRVFILYKFRSMRVDAERTGAQWAAQKDPRATAFGQFLRHTHLDELPQLINILKGDLSFVGPRPERPEFVVQLREQVPFYDLRHLITPGVTGWAQVNYKKDATVEDVIQKLEHDVYYLKNRSFVMDVAIILKTIKSLFADPQ